MQQERRARVYIPQVPNQRLYMCVECRTESKLWYGACPNCGAIGSRGERRWVPKEIDLTSASTYGDPIVIWPATNTGAAIDRRRMEDEAIGVAEKYDDRLDYVVALGSPTLIAVLAWAIGREDKILRMLEWSKNEKVYHPTFGTELYDIID